MNELTLDGKTYVSSRRAAEITGYAKDYVGQLCREGRVEARLVGRNWYILESAIREHRFGSGEKKEEEVEIGRNYASAAWEAPRYAAETAPAIPSLSDRAGVNALSDTLERQYSAPHEATDSMPSTLLTDMQSAWQEWYEHREAGQVAEKIATEPIAAEVSEEYQPEVASISEEIHEDDSLPAEPTPETMLDLSHVYVNAYEGEAEGEEEEPLLEEGIIIEEKVRNKRGGIKVNVRPVLIRSVLVAVMLLVIAVTVIGSGLLEEFGGRQVTRSSEIRFLAGVSSYNH